MGRRAAALNAPAATRRGLRVLFYLTGAVLVLVSGIWLYSTVDQFLITDSRFFLPGPPESGTSSIFFRIEGAEHASEQQITAVFSRDFGRSIYLCRIAERRRRLLAIDWVKEASVSRVWPNRVVVRIQERTPVAFIQVPGPNRMTMYALIDRDGVVLDPQRASDLPLPVLAGVPSDEPEAARRERVARFLRLQTELGKHMEKVSEIDVSDIDNVKIVQQFDNRAITLMLGDQKFRERLEMFLDNVKEIRQHMPDATTLDLRLTGRITAAGGGKT